MIAFALSSLVALTHTALANTAVALPLAECLRTNRIDRWYIEHERALIVRSGRRHFRIEMRNACPTLGDGGLLSLRGTQATRDFICGNVGEMVSTRWGPCSIGRVTALTHGQFLQQVESLQSRRSNRAGAHPRTAQERAASQPRK